MEVGIQNPFCRIDWIYSIINWLENLKLHDVDSDENGSGEFLYMLLITLYVFSLVRNKVICLYAGL